MLNKKVITIVTAVIAALVILGFVLTVYIIKKDNVGFYVAPRSAILKLNDKAIEINKTQYITPGSYSISIAAQGFVTIKQDITITDTYKAFSFCLVPINQSSEDYVKAHPEDVYICEGAAGQAYDKETKEAIAKYPILAKLPYEDGAFSIGQGMTEQHEIAIYVHYSSPKSKNEAIDWIHRYQKDGLPVIISTDDYSQTGRIGGEDSQLDQVLVKKYPIIKLLPLDASIYKIGYRIDQSDPNGDSIKLTILSDTSSGRMAALKEIYAQGYNPIDYKIEFLGFESEVN